ncbi:MAG TPA: VapC toxin family PIN domain ribonuclease, partial [Burkholderiaceae bacterium]|nr:VapC toxin family PIN domain ribonuclease [Burkholderiaceae bacterium]
VELATSGAEWALLRSKLLDGDLRGNLVTDAWIAASVELLSERLATFDRDFRKLLSSRSVTLLGSK